MNDERVIHNPGSVAIKDDIIHAVGDSSELDSRFAPLRRIDASNHVILPGLINLHCHASNSLIRGIGRDLPLGLWLEQVCWPRMQSADPEDLFHATLLSCVEMLGNGITTFVDMWQEAEATTNAVKQSGQRVHLAYNIKDFGDTERGQGQIARALDAYRRWHGTLNRKISVGLGPHSVYACNETTLSTCAQIMDNDDLSIHIHASETAEEVELAQQQYGVTPIQVLHRLDLLGDRTTVAHAVHVTEDDIQLLRETNTAIAHNISSNLILGSGIAPLKRFLEEDIRTGLGTDGPGSNDALDLLADLRLAVLVQRGVLECAEQISALEALAMVTSEGAKALGMEKRIGSLEAGKKADVILLNLDHPHLYPQWKQLPGNIPNLIVFSARGSDVDTVILDGQILKENNRFTLLEPATIATNAQASFTRIQQRLAPL